MKLFTRLVTLMTLLVASSAADTVTLSKEKFLDKCKGAWAGQMIGVCYGAPYEFRSNAKPITDPLRDWKSEFVEGAIDQDDCYVEMTFLKTIEDHGLNVTYEQAGKAFAASQYPLWHANYYGRENCRRGVMPPMSGHPLYNRHADDIDFQIEADLFGILCPGLPQESNRLCDIFGRVMNYGDGLYGGMFVSGMYTAAYFEDSDVRKVIDAGLACIPKESQYHQCISDVIAWHAAEPNDWLAVWKKIEDKWQDDIDCSPDNTFNIDAKLNGAYIVMGLLYGNGDFAKTVEISTRCGQDADCNPSNAVGVLGCIKGFKAIGEPFTAGIAKMADTKFSHTDYSFNSLIPTCQRVTEQIIKHAGGKIADDAYTFTVQAPTPPTTLEQWTEQKALLAIPISATEMAWWDPKWTLVACGTDMEPGLRGRALGRDNVLVLHPVSESTPAAMTASFHVPAGGRPELRIDTASAKQGDYVLKVFINNEPKIEKIIDTKGEWTTVTFDLMPYTNKDIDIRIENAANGWSYEAGYFGTVTVSP
ncbi:MAG: ADP-ribosylglycohydrolase family protein [Candidatus Hydrogenedentes bacterium]|nr:ADP-ribosylglycohydrolase family protein [Candidatus Hydrogenedentota bacterium]